MRIDVALLPGALTPELLSGRTAVVFDVLRATSSIVTALANGAAEVRVYPDLDSLRAAARTVSGPRLLAGETRCVRPADFDLGNSPPEFTSDAVAGRILLLATTNGTRAIHAALGARRVLIGSLLNAAAVAREVLNRGDDLTLICSGTQGEIADEDRCGCGAVLDALMLLDSTAVPTAEALACRELFRASRADLVAFFGTTTGGRHISNAGLTNDLAAAAQLNSDTVVPFARETSDAVTVRT